jgi:hypothetical protein
LRGKRGGGDDGYGGYYEPSDQSRFQSLFLEEFESLFNE